MEIHIVMGILGYRNQEPVKAYPDEDIAEKKRDALEREREETVEQNLEAWSNGETPEKDTPTYDGFYVQSCELADAEQ